MYATQIYPCVFKHKPTTTDTDARARQGHTSVCFKHKPTTTDTDARARQGHTSVCFKHKPTTTDTDARARQGHTERERDRDIQRESE
jgi:hypothetical protein